MRVESFNKALCFTDRPLRANEKLTFRISRVTRAWSGTLRVGVTIHDPDTFEDNLPKYCCPDLNMKPGNWGKAVEEAHALENNVLQVFYTSQGNVMLKVNSNDPGVFLSGVRTGVPLFVLFDVYGNTLGIELGEVQLRNSTTPAGTTQAVRNAASTLVPSQRLNNTNLRSECFPNIALHPAQLSCINTSHVQASSNVANGLMDCPGGLVMTETALRAGQALIVKLADLHREVPMNLALSAATTDEIRRFNSLDDLYDKTYTVLFKSGVTTAGEEIAVVISEQGIVHVSHANKKWLQCVYVDPVVQFRVVFDMQTVKKLSVVGITTHLQAPANQIDGGDGSSKSEQKKASGNNSDRAPIDCVICLENLRDTLLKPCLHFVLCGGCARSLSQSDHKECPICRKPIKGTEKIYMN